MGSKTEWFVKSQLQRYNLVVSVEDSRKQRIHAAFAENCYCTLVCYARNNLGCLLMLSVSK